MKDFLPNSMKELEQLQHQAVTTKVELIKLHKLVEAKRLELNAIEKYRNLLCSVSNKMLNARNIKEAAEIQTKYTVKLKSAKSKLTGKSIPAPVDFHQDTSSQMREIKHLMGLIETLST